MRKLGRRAALLLACVSFSGAAVAAKVAGKTYDVTEFGATNDGASLCTTQIQSAIEACATSGGGIVVVPKGTFLSGAIFLKPGVNLRLEEGAVLRAST
ncbi:MAG: glycoside hydrolase, partial [Verrucomicrobia bacterium]